MIKKCASVLLVLIIVLGLVGCKNSITGNDGGYTVYYINASETGLETVSYSLKTKGDEAIKELITVLSSVSSEEDYIAPLENIPCRIRAYKDKKLELSFGKEYNLLDETKEILVRAAVVRTMIQLEDIEGIAFYVDSQPLKDVYDSEIGTMRENSFLDYFGKEQDAILSEDLVIYYADAQGTSLIKEGHRVYFDSSMSLEQAVIQYLSESPDRQDAKVAVAPNFNAINITTSERTCYLDIDFSFFRQLEGVSYDTSIYAIVNSLCSLNGISAVNINVISTDNSASDEAAQLSGIYEMNDSLVIN